jgi:hypothetical protein
MNRRFGTEPERDFRAVMLDEGARVQRNWHPFLCYGRIGRYAEQLARYQALFPAEQLRVYLYEDSRGHPETSRYVAARSLPVVGLACELASEGILVALCATCKGRIALTLLVAGTSLRLTLAL